MNWIFEAYASVYQTATGMGRPQGGNAAVAKKSECDRHGVPAPTR
jgi:hypothetical protein